MQSFKLKFKFSISTVGSIQNRISTFCNLLQSHDLSYPKSSPKAALDKIVKFNHFVYKNPYIFSSFAKKNDENSDFLKNLTNFKNSLISTYKLDTFLQIKDLFPIYQFLLFYNDSRDIYIEEMDKISLKKIKFLDFENNLEILWLNCLRKLPSKNSKFIDFLLNNHKTRISHALLKTPLAKAMLSQITLLYNMEKKEGFEDVAINDSLILCNFEKIQEFIGKKSLKEFQNIEGFWVPLYDENEAIVYEIININEKKTETIIYNRIRTEYLIEKGIKVKGLVMEADKEGIVQEMQFL